jgi:hypothetical protein
MSAGGSLISLRQWRCEDTSIEADTNRISSLIEPRRALHGAAGGSITAFSPYTSTNHHHKQTRNIFFCRSLRAITGTDKIFLFFRLRICPALICFLSFLWLQPMRLSLSAERTRGAEPFKKNIHTNFISSLFCR